jgi:hypothetical protein
MVIIGLDASKMAQIGRRADLRPRQPARCARALRLAKPAFDNKIARF